MRFLSTPSARRATLPLHEFHRSSFLFLSTPSARRATALDCFILQSPQYFYPRPPRGGRLNQAHLLDLTYRFLSTPSARRATAGGLRWSEGWQDFYPRPPRGGRQGHHPGSHGAAEISIHALREEGDLVIGQTVPNQFAFLSTPSARRATHGLSQHSAVLLNFYPRPPRGGRRQD